jgi:hypothetical protein
MSTDKMQAAFEAWNTYSLATFKQTAWSAWQHASGVQAAEIARLTDELANARSEQVVEQKPVRTKLAPMEDEEGKVWQWYFDCAGHYIDIVLDDNGKYSVFFRDRSTRGEAWLDQADEPAIAHPQPSAVIDPVAESTVSVDAVMQMVQEFASTWSVVGGRFDDGTASERAEELKQAIRNMLTVNAVKTKYDARDADLYRWNTPTQFDAAIVYMKGEK